MLTGETLRTSIWLEIRVLATYTQVDPSVLMEQIIASTIYLFKQNFQYEYGSMATNRRKIPSLLAFMNNDL